MRTRSPAHLCVGVRPVPPIVFVNAEVAFFSQTCPPLSYGYNRAHAQPVKEKNYILEALPDPYRSNAYAVTVDLKRVSFGKIFI